MNLKGLKVFVTGGAGFIGSNIVESLVKAGAKVKVYDNFSSGLMDNLKPFVKDIEIVNGDICDLELLTSEMKGYEVCSHMAAQLEITTSINDPIKDLEVNTIGTLNVLNASLKNGVSKIINASSACTYGQSLGIVDEEYPQFPNWEYGTSKLSAERYCYLYADSKNIDIASLRFSIVYGRNEWYGRVLTIFLKRASQGLNPVVFGYGEQIRDFIYVSDAVDLHNACITNDSIKNECFNVSTGIPTTVVELAKKVAEVHGLEVIHENVLPGQHSKIVDENRMRLPSELGCMLLDNTKAKNLLDWEPKIGLDLGLKLEYDWLLENKNRWQKMSY